jgi:hypothetical protein
LDETTLDKKGLDKKFSPLENFVNFVIQPLV